MARIKRFEDIEAWQDARKLTHTIYEITRSDAFARDFDLRRQMRRAAVSIMANIAEGFERGGSKEFIHFLTIARASAAEVKSLLYVALDEAYIPRPVFDGTYAQASRIGRQLNGFIGYLKTSARKGNKFDP